MTQGSRWVTDRPGSAGLSTSTGHWHHVLELDSEWCSGFQPAWAGPGCPDTSRLCRWRAPWRPGRSEPAGSQARSRRAWARRGDIMLWVLVMESLVLIVTGGPGLGSQIRALHCRESWSSESHGPAPWVTSVKSPGPGRATWSRSFLPGPLLVTSSRQNLSSRHPATPFSVPPPTTGRPRGPAAYPQPEAQSILRVRRRSQLENSSGVRIPSQAEDSELSPDQSIYHQFLI